MNRTVKRLTLTAALVGLTALPAQAQTGWGALGIHAGWMNPAPLAEGPAQNLSIDQNVGVGGSLDLWFGQSRRFGIGAEGTWSGWTQWRPDFGPAFGRDVNLFQYDASLQWRFARPTVATRFLPYISLGVGGVTLDPRGDPPPEFTWTPGDVVIDTERRTQLAVVGAIGTDWFVTPNVALRLQLKDYWTDRSPFRRASTGEFHSGGHNFLLNGGLSFYFGPRVEEPLFVAEEPIVPPPPPPPPPPAEETVLVCIVDPADYQIRTIEAIHIPAEDRLMVMRNGQRVAFETAFPTTPPTYARGATWYMQDRPLMIDLEPGVTVPADQRTRLELVLFGTPAQRSPEELMFVGTIEGTPIYARRADVAPFAGRLETQLAVSQDLGTVLRADPDLAREFGAVTTYYVAVEPHCVFQPVSVTHFVRRVRG